MLRGQFYLQHPIKTAGRLLFLALTLKLDIWLRVLPSLTVVRTTFEL